MLKFIGGLVVVGCLALGALAYFGYVDLSGNVALTDKSTTMIDDSVDQGRTGLSEGLDSLSNKVRPTP